MSKIGKTMETGSRVLVARDDGMAEEDSEWLLDGLRGFLGG